MYRVDPSHPVVVEQVQSLPYDALDGYADAVGVMELDPWRGEPISKDNPDGNIRTLPFGRGGMVIYLVLERDREVYVIEVLWAG